MNQDPIPHQIASRLGLTLDPSSYQKMDHQSFERIALASTQMYEGLYGENFRAVYVEKARVGCGHSKVGVLVFENFLRVSLLPDEGTGHEKKCVGVQELMISHEGPYGLGVHHECEFDGFGSRTRG